MKAILILLNLILCVKISFGQTKDISQKSVRDHISFDQDWKFALGNSIDPSKDFNARTGYFSYFAKTGYGDGPADPNFDDRAWRILDIPHDWAVELPFDVKGGHSHGYRALGRNFPENSIGWYRKRFFVPKTDDGRRIVIEFEGVFRNSTVWVNGFYAGTEQSGYSSFSYDITDYLKYGKDNVITVRVDATMEEGWFYEGAGIYRHVWLSKTDALHVESNGTFITSEISGSKATIKIRTTIRNEKKQSVSFQLDQNLVDCDGNQMKSVKLDSLVLKPGESRTYFQSMNVAAPHLWTLEDPYMHQLVTVVKTKEVVADHYTTQFGIRTLRFDPELGFFLNGKNIKIKGTCNHQDHAGVGTAIPDDLQEFRIRQLKSMGSNAIRSAHNPASPAFLEACDRLGMLVLEENRLMGSSDEHFRELQSMICRDRNHPSIFLWSLGNEEWSIEGNDFGARIASTMQAFAQKLDSSRRFTVAISGGWGQGISTVVDVMGFNYLTHGDIDLQHKQYPFQPSIGTEETSGSGTRGVYTDQKDIGHMMAEDRNGNGSIETGWKYYLQRPFLSGLFFWTGFDYRGEPNPLVWPAVSSEYGIMDVCGFPKDVYYYLKSWWTKDTVLHIFPHWNWKVQEGKLINVWIESNCDEVELFLNKKSLGRQSVPRNGHLEWNVRFAPGTLMARGFMENNLVVTSKVETTSNAYSLDMIADRKILNSNSENVSVISLQIKDKQGLIVPTANDTVVFNIQGPGKIIGVGNGDPASHEPDKYLDKISTVTINHLLVKSLMDTINFTEVKNFVNDSSWTTAFKKRDSENRIVQDTSKFLVIKGGFNLQDFSDQSKISLLAKSLVENQSLFVNGFLVARNVDRNNADQTYVLDHKILRVGCNNYLIEGVPFVKKNPWEALNTDPGVIQVIEANGNWKRKAFNGLLQVIVKNENYPGDIILTASAKNLKSNVISIHNK